MNPWYIWCAIVVTLLSVLLLLLAAWEFYQMRLHYHRDLISRLVANRLSLVWDDDVWLVYPRASPFTPIGRYVGPRPLAQHSRWELAVQQALDVLSTKGSQSRKERSTVGGRPEQTDG